MKIDPKITNTRSKNNFKKILLQINDSTNESNDSFHLFNLDEFIYTNVDTPSKVICIKNGHETQKTITLLRRKNMDCVKCRNYSLTDEQFKENIEKLVGDEYTFLEDYIDDTTHIQVKHIICGKIYKTTPNNFMKGRRCKSCSEDEKGLKMRKTKEQFNEEVFSLVGKDYTFLEDYIKDDTEIKVKHNVCGFVYKVTPTHFLQNRRCPSCSKTGFDPSKKAILYYLRVKHYNKTYYKIGITNLSLKERYSESMFTSGKLTEVNTINYEDGSQAKEKEKEILNKYKDKLLNKKRTSIMEEQTSILGYHTGDSELFTEDILNLDMGFKH